MSIICGIKHLDRKSATSERLTFEFFTLLINKGLNAPLASVSVRIRKAIYSDSFGKSFSYVSSER